MEIAKNGDVRSLAIAFEHASGNGGKFWNFINGNVFQLTGLLEDLKLDLLMGNKERNPATPLEK